MAFEKTTQADPDATAKELAEAKAKLAELQFLEELEADPDEIRNAVGFRRRALDKDPTALEEMQKHYGTVKAEKPEPKKGETGEDREAREELAKLRAQVQAGQMSADVDRVLSRKGWEGVKITDADKRKIFETMRRHGVSAADALKMDACDGLQKKRKAAAEAKKEEAGADAAAKRASGGRGDGAGSSGKQPTTEHKMGPHGGVFLDHEQLRAASKGGKGARRKYLGDLLLAAPYSR